MQEDIKFKLPSLGDISFIEKLYKIQLAIVQNNSIIAGNYGPKVCYSDHFIDPDYINNKELNGGA